MVEAGHNPAQDLKKFVTPDKNIRKMTVSEAKLILEVDKVSDEEIEKQFQKFYMINDPVKGGSFYLQCKAIGAKEILKNTKK